MSYKTLNLDLAKTPILKPIIYGRIGDEDMQSVTVNITSRDAPVDLTGYTITFEGITNGGQTKVFDVGGIKATDLKKGSFTYTFPNMAFAVAGNYEIAYFSILKGKQRDTTGEFDIIVGNNADIDAAEAETIITEYNKLVEELHEITDKYISDSDVKFADLNQKIADLKTLIAQYNTNVQKIADYNIELMNSTKDTAVNTVNTTASNAVKTINDALEEFKKGDFYTKAEADAKFATGQSLTDLSNKVVANKGNLAIGDDLNDIRATGFYRIGGFVGETEILNVPAELSGVKFYAFVTVTEALQELTVYAPINSTTWTYSRSISGTTPTWSNWSKTVMADDSGKVSIGTLDSNTLTVQGTKIYPNTKDGVWTIERLFDNEYRLTTVMSTDAAVTNAWNSLFISSEVAHPTLPAGYTKTSWGVTLSNSNNLMWCSISAASAFRLIAGASTSAGTRTVIVTVYASK